MSDRVITYRPASWRGDDPHGAKGLTDVPWVCVRADAALPSRDAVAEVLLREAHPYLAPWPWAELCASVKAGVVVALELARRQADALLAKWPAAPERGGEPVAWGIAAADGTVVETYLFKIRADRMAADLNSTHDKCGPFRVVALVTRESHRESPSKEP